MNTNLSKEFWDQNYKSNKTGWDLGKVSPPLQEYFNQLTNKGLKILIPGGGNSYEAEYLHQLGFKNVFVVDLSKSPLENIQKRVLGFPLEYLIQKNFFDLDIRFNNCTNIFLRHSSKIKARIFCKSASFVNEKRKGCGSII